MKDGDILFTILNTSHAMCFSRLICRYCVPAVFSRSWGTIKQILNRTRSNQNISDVFLIDNVMTTDPTILANKFNTFFADIGLRLSESVNNTHNALFTDYLLNPSMHDFTFELITEETTMKILNTGFKSYRLSWLQDFIYPLPSPPLPSLTELVLVWV